MNKKETQPQLFVFDFSVIKQILEGKNEEKSKDILEKMAGLKAQNKDVVAITTTSNFLRALYLAENIEKKMVSMLLETIIVIPSAADFKDDKAVMNDVLSVIEKLNRASNGSAT